MKHIPLSNGFMLTSLLGLMISIFLTLNGSLNETWAFLLNLMFILFIVASFVSATPDGDEVRLK